jgi:hypothetical protein
LRDAILVVAFLAIATTVQVRFDRSPGTFDANAAERADRTEATAPEQVNEPRVFRVEHRTERARSAAGRDECVTTPSAPAFPSVETTKGEAIGVEPLVLPAVRVLLPTRT